DEPAVRHAVLTGGGVDARDPQSTELALLRPPVAVRVIQRVPYLFLGRPEGAALGAVVPLGRLEDLAAVLLAVDGALDAGHVSAPLGVQWASWRRTWPASAELTSTNWPSSFFWPRLLAKTWLLR